MALIVWTYDWVPERVCDRGAFRKAVADQLAQFQAADPGDRISN